MIVSHLALSKSSVMPLFYVILKGEFSLHVIFVIKVKCQGHNKVKSNKCDRQLAYVVTIKVIFSLSQL